MTDRNDLYPAFAPQEQDVLDFIKKHGSITPLDAIGFGCFRLSARICDLRAKGVPIKSEMIPVINRKGQTCRVARYWISAA